MAFRTPPPRPYVPPKNPTTQWTVLVITVIIILLIIVILYFSLVRLLALDCKSDLDCPFATGKCVIDTGLCVECLRTTDCPSGQYCSTKNTCV